MSIFCPKIYTIYTTHILLITKIQKYLNANCPNSHISKNIKTLDFFNSNFSDVFILKKYQNSKIFQKLKKKLYQTVSILSNYKLMLFIVQFEILTFDKKYLDATFHQLFKNGSISFFSSSKTLPSHQLTGCHATDIKTFLICSLHVLRCLDLWCQVIGLTWLIVDHLRLDNLHQNYHHYGL